MHTLVVEKKSKLFEIENEPFQLVVSLLTEMCDNLDLTTGGDFIAGKTILDFATKMYKKDGSDKLFLQGSIRTHFIWQNLFFWEEYFWDSAAGSIPWTLDPSSESNYSKSQKEFLGKYIKTFATQMLDWGNLPSPAVQLFVSNITNDLGFDDDQALSKINTFLDQQEALIQKKLAKQQEKKRDAAKKEKTLAKAPIAVSNPEMKLPDKAKLDKEKEKEKEKEREKAKEKEREKEKEKEKERAKKEKEKEKLRLSEKEKKDAEKAAEKAKMTQLMESDDESEELLFEVEVVADYMGRNDSELSLKRGQHYAIFEVDAKKEWYLTELEEVRAWIPAVYTKILAGPPAGKEDDKSKPKDDKKAKEDDAKKKKK